MKNHLLLLALLGAQTLWSLTEREELANRLLWLKADMKEHHEAYRAERVFWCNRGIEVPPFYCSTLTEEERNR